MIGPAPRVARDTVTGLVLALACLAFSAIGLTVNEPATVDYVDGRRGEPVSLERAEVTVGEVQVGTRLVDRGDVEGQTTGMFVAVRVSLAVPSNKRVSLNRSRLVTQTRTYDTWTNTSVAAEPGFQTTSDLAFEVDPAQIDDLTLELWNGGVVEVMPQRARIHLGITPANADQWRRAAVGRDLDPEPYGSTEALP